MGGVSREPRVAVMILVEARWEEPDGSLRTAPARMEDRSASGACLRMQKQIRVGSSLQIQSHREQFTGVARYCRRDGREYLVGIQRDTVAGVFPRPPAATVAALTLAGTELGLSTVAPATLHRRKKDRAAGNAPTKPRTRRVRARVEIGELCPDANDAGEHGILLLQPPDILQRPETPSPVNERLDDKERKPMHRKFFDLAKWHNKQETPTDSNKGGKDLNHPPEATSPAEASSTNRAPQSSKGFQAELWPVEDIYRGAGIMNPHKGYSIIKVVDMLGSARLRGLSKEMRRAAVLMALDAAGVPISEVLRDAKARQEALDFHEARQKKDAESEWARKAEENIQIEAELERVKAHYAARISRNLEAVAREKAAFSAWLTMKQKESQGMAEAVAVCGESVAPEPTCVSAPDTRPAASSKPLELGAAAR